MRNLKFFEIFDSRNELLEIMAGFLFLKTFFVDYILVEFSVLDVFSD